MHVQEPRQLADLDSLAHDLLRLAPSIYLSIVKAAIHEPVQTLVRWCPPEELSRQTKTYKFTPASRHWVISFLACRRKRLRCLMDVALTEHSSIASTNLLYINLSPKCDPGPIRQSADLKQDTVSYVSCRFRCECTEVNCIRSCPIRHFQLDVHHAGVAGSHTELRPSQQRRRQHAWCICIPLVLCCLDDCRPFCSPSALLEPCCRLFLLVRPVYLTEMADYLRVFLLRQ